MLDRESADENPTESQPSEPFAGSKARSRRLNAIRAEMQARLAKAAIAAGAEAAQPRCDEVFAAGVRWLDELAGEPV